MSDFKITNGKVTYHCGECDSELLAVCGKLVLKQTDELPHSHRGKTVIFMCPKCDKEDLQ